MTSPKLSTYHVPFQHEYGAERSCRWCGKVLEGALRLCRDSTPCRETLRPSPEEERDQRQQAALERFRGGGT